MGHFESALSHLLEIEHHRVAREIRVAHPAKTLIALVAVGLDGHHVGPLRTGRLNGGDVTFYCIVLGVGGGDAINTESQTHTHTHTTCKCECRLQPRLETND